MCGNACAAGEVCAAGQCNLNCVGGTTKCSNTCVDTKSDPGNCGACGVVCAAGQVCTNGQCAGQCAPGTTKCGNLCVDTQLDPSNCGMCGVACAAGEVCSNGTCGGSCAAGTTKCGNECVDMQTDEANCGMCGNACLPSVACYDGVCQPAGGCDTLNDCGTCQQCAFDGLCSDELATCANNQECVDLFNCLNPASGVCDQACQQQCAQQYPNAIDTYVDILDCIFCQECGSSCGVDPMAFGCPASCDNQNNCQSCFDCSMAMGGICEDDLQICLNNPECTMLSACINMCPAGDVQCQVQCEQTHPFGVADYNAIIICGVCQECPNDCNNGMACP
ncbi:hypothetical protein GF068_29090 [Polyangium spumosum]|uniref:4Fe-4S ferredoxin-type domain-containing protein n=2 Tax=Polyangium spumosum TaxID=889282 RepID=A0A6N7Q088_9BACT|nr:hypothetical protein [Polyangium spumosum]